MSKILKFRDAWVCRPHAKLELNDGVSNVETAGYVSAERRITDMINAGQRLVDYRREHFDSVDIKPGEDLEIDPTRRPGFDMADASQIIEGFKRRKRVVEKPKKASTEVVKEDQKDVPIPEPAEKPA